MGGAPVGGAPVGGAPVGGAPVGGWQENNGIKFHSSISPFLKTAGRKRTRRRKDK